MNDAANRVITILVSLFIFSACQGSATNDGGLISPKALSDAPAVLPEWLGEHFSRSATAHFYVAHDTGPAEANELANQLEAAYDQFYLFFGKLGFELQPLRESLGWIHFSDTDDFTRYTLRADRMDLSHLKGYYSSRTNRVAVVGPHFIARPTPENDPSVQPHTIAAMAVDDPHQEIVKIAHELAHQLAFNTGLQKRGVMYPLWASEGLATQYETELSYCQDRNVARCDRLVEMRDQGRLLPLTEFVSMTRLPADRTRCEDIYAQAWGLFKYLAEYRSAELRDYLERLHARTPGFRSAATLYQDFTLCFGVPDTLPPEWVHDVCER